MTIPSEQTSPPVFDLKRFNSQNPSSEKLIDKIAQSLGLAPVPPAPEPTSAQIKRELWTNPTLPGRIATTIGHPLSTEQKKADEPAQESPVAEKPLPVPVIEKPDIKPTSQDIRSKLKPTAIKTGTLNLNSTGATHILVPKKPIAKDTSPPQVDKILKKMKAKPSKAPAHEDEIPPKPVSAIHVLISAILAVLFITIDCHSALHNVPNYMIFVRLGAFALGFIYTAATAWRSTGLKLALSVIIMILFLFHFNNNAPILSIIEHFNTL